MSTATVEYIGGLRTKATHTKSGTTFVTDAPIDNHGKGESFSPTDLVATAYASCMLTIIGIYCESRKLAFTNGKVSVEKIMGSEPRHIAELKIAIDISGNGWTEREQKKIVKLAKACPVARSVDKKMLIVLEFITE